MDWIHLAPAGVSQTAREGLSRHSSTVAERSLGAESVRTPAGADPERVFELSPQAARALPLRIVGPGRRERDYITRAAHLSSALETLELLERGANRRLDRVEHDLVGERTRHARTRAQANRVLVALGALQRENEMLRARVAALEAPARPALREAPQGAPPKRPAGLWQRFRRSR